MGTGEDSKTVKPTKPTPSTQETAPVTPSYHDWSSSMQAYYGAGATTPPFFATPTPHPYMWGGQHALIPPYGAAVPYPALYPPGAVYPHPSAAQVPFSQIPTNMGQINVESESKADDGKDRVAVIKKTKGTSGTVGAIGSKGSTVEAVKAASGSGNDGATESAETGSEDSSDTNDDSNQEECARNTVNKNKGSFHQMLAEGSNAQSNNASGPSLHGNPANNLNVGGMELWNAGAVKMRPNHHPPATSVAPGGIIAASGQWVQDDRELKRQKRKQSNRESARRSRLRKQAECEELQIRVESLTSENHSLRDELNRLSEECEKLTSENNSIKEELTAVCGSDAVLKKLESNGVNNHHTHSRSSSCNEGNS